MAPEREIAGTRILDAGYRATSSSSFSWRVSSFRRRPDRRPDRLLYLPCSASFCALNDLLRSEQLPELLQTDLNVGPPHVPPVVVFAPASLESRSTGLGADGVIVGSRAVALEPHGPRRHQPRAPLRFQLCRRGEHLLCRLRVGERAPPSPPAMRTSAEASSAVDRSRGSFNSLAASTASSTSATAFFGAPEIASVSASVCLAWSAVSL